MKNKQNNKQAKNCGNNKNCGNKNCKNSSENHGYENGGNND